MKDNKAYKQKNNEFYGVLLLKNLKLNNSLPQVYGTKLSIKLGPKLFKYWYPIVLKYVQRSHKYVKPHNVRKQLCLKGYISDFMILS